MTFSPRLDHANPTGRLNKKPLHAEVSLSGIGHDADDELSGIFRPVRSFYTADGSYCRQYRSTVAFEKDVHSGNDMACLRANGSWQVVSDDFS